MQQQKTSVGTMTQKAGEKEGTNKTVVKLKLKQNQRVKSRVIKTYPLGVIAVFLLGVFAFVICKYACKHAEQITPTEPKGSTKNPKSEGKDKEVPLYRKPGIGDNFITYIPNFHHTTPSDPKKPTESDGIDINGTSKNDTNSKSYFEWQNSLQIVYFPGPYEAMSIETELDEDVEENECAQAHSFMVVSVIFIFVLMFIFIGSFLFLLWMYCYKNSDVSETLTV